VSKANLVFSRHQKQYTHTHTIISCQFIYLRCV
jgi:hypothetical protein